MPTMELTAAAVLAILDRHANADPEERKRLFRALTLRAHPDKGGDAAAFDALQQRRARFLS